MYEARQHKEKVSRTIGSAGGRAQQIIQRDYIYRKFQKDEDKFPTTKVDPNINMPNKVNNGRIDIKVKVVPTTINDYQSNGLSVFTKNTNRSYRSLPGASKKVNSDNFGNNIALDNSQSEHRLIISRDGNYNNYIAALNALNWQVDNPVPADMSSAGQLA